MSRCAGKVCPTTKICNPKSGRCVLIKGSIGKKLLQKSRSRGKVKSRSRSVKAKSRSRGKCANKTCKTSDKICNPASGRCVNRRGDIGKGLVGKSPTESPTELRIKLQKETGIIAPAGPDSLDITKKVEHPFGRMLDDFIPNNYVLVKEIPGGSFGKIYLACDPSNRFDCKIYKIVPFTKGAEHEFKLEVGMQKKFAAHGLAPKIYRQSLTTFKGKKYGILEMERIAGTLNDILKEKVSHEVLDKIIEWLLDIIDAMCKYNLVHGDFHLANIAFNLIHSDHSDDPDAPGEFAIQLLPIDFGWSCCIKKDIACIPQLEMSQLLRTLSTKPRINEENEKYLQAKLLAVYRRNYNPNLANNYMAFDKENETYLKAYVREWKKQG